jgi:hypothetical protein
MRSGSLLHDEPPNKPKKPGAQFENKELALKSQQQAAETRQAQLFTQVYSRYDRDFWRDWLIYMGKNYRNYDEWDRDRDNVDISSARLAVATYMMGIGTLVKRGLLSPEIVSDLISGPVIMFWQKYSPLYMEYRVRASFPTYAADLEFLYDALMKLKPSGYSPIYRPDASGVGRRGGDD